MKEKPGAIRGGTNFSGGSSFGGGSKPSVAAQRALYQAQTGKPFKVPRPKPVKKAAPSSRSAVRKFVEERKQERRAAGEISKTRTSKDPREVARRLAIEKRKSRRGDPGRTAKNRATRIDNLLSEASRAAAGGDMQRAASLRRLAADVRAGKSGPYVLSPGKGSAAFSRTQKPPLDDRTKARIQDLEKQASEATRRGDMRAATSARRMVDELKRGTDPTTNAAREQLRPPSTTVYRTPRGFGTMERKPRKGPGKK